MITAQFGHMDRGANHEIGVVPIGVVDNDESVREALGSLLRSVGYKCAVFASAEEFLDSGRTAVSTD
jgi:FixJ family two-component response regulator